MLHEADHTSCLACHLCCAVPLTLPPCHAPLTGRVGGSLCDILYNSMLCPTGLLALFAFSGLPLVLFFSLLCLPLPHPKLPPFTIPFYHACRFSLCVWLHAHPGRREGGGVWRLLQTSLPPFSQASYHGLLPTSNNVTMDPWHVFSPFFALPSTTWPHVLLTIWCSGGHSFCDVILVSAFSMPGCAYMPEWRWPFLWEHFAERAFV